jgi:hypothetical protein
MAIVMNMSSYVIEEMSTIGSASGDEATRPEMNPQLRLAMHQNSVAQQYGNSIMPASLAEIDVEMFLQAMSSSLLCEQRYSC